MGLRRVILAVALGLAVWTLVLPPAGADTYPPVPDDVPAPVAVQSPPVVVVRGAPSPRGGLVRTGFSGVLPFAALATGGIVFGATVVTLTHRRRSAS